MVDAAVRSFWLWFAVACAAPPLVGQETVEAQLDRATQQNRTGAWREAAAAAESVLERDGITGQQRARALYTAAYGSLRAAERERARRHLDELSELEAELAVDGWLPKAARELRAELGGTAAEAPVAEDGFWQPLAEAARARLDAGALAAYESIARRGGADAYLLVWEDRIVVEWRSERYREPMYAMSSTKSVTALLVGMLLDRGRLRDLDQTAGELLPDWREGRRGEVTLRHLLSHTSGLDNRARRGEQGVGGVSDKNAHVRALVPDRPPGEHFSYSNEGVQLLSPILDAAAGEPIQDFAQRELFAPLGMRDSRLHLDAERHAWTYADMETTPRDLARLGLLMLHGGELRGRCVVSREWVRQCTRPSQELNRGCGLLWWLFDGDSGSGFAAQGYLGTDVHVLPGPGIVAVRMQSKPGPEGDPGPAYRREVVPVLARLVHQ